jgi:hypothetical protein
VIMQFIKQSSNNPKLRIRIQTLLALGKMAKVQALTATSLCFKTYTNGLCMDRVLSVICTVSET